MAIFRTSSVYNIEHLVSTPYYRAWRPDLNWLKIRGWRNQQYKAIYVNDSSPFFFAAREKAITEPHEQPMKKVLMTCPRALLGLHPVG